MSRVIEIALRRLSPDSQRVLMLLLLLLGGGGGEGRPAGRVLWPVTFEGLTLTMRGA